MRPMLATIAAATLALSATAPLVAAPCKDAKGKFVACPKAAPKPMRCKNAKGHFAKCGTPGAKPL